ncbi:MAG: hypothetical protein AseanaTS_24700 [Candidatus Pelagadaptatus aseana]|uniref:DUF3080 family protein n=1 Tax=Candidatus Pelagadaptatus aseana TaxID=3120508 RepID=UPI0039B175A4
MAVRLALALRVLLLVLALVLLTTACSSRTELESELDDYLTRLSRVLDEEILTTQTEPLTRLRTRKIDVPRVKITVLDFLGLLGCELQYTIGERNSSMGRMATDSQRLLNTLRLLQQAPPCIQRLRDNERQEQADELQALMQLKRDQLPALIYNATLAGPEFDAFWSMTVARDYPENVSTEVVDALIHLSNFIDSWLSDEPTIDSRQLELTLGLIRSGDGGALLRSLAVSAASLRSASSMIDARLERRPVCLAAQPNKTSKTFERVVLRSFIGAVQPRQARLNQRYYDLIEPIHRIEQQLHSILPEDYQLWRSLRGARFESFMQAPRNHIEAIKQIPLQCGSNFGR